MGRTLQPPGNCASDMVSEALAFGGHASRNSRIYLRIYANIGKRST
jgi:hypothetical protein